MSNDLEPVKTSKWNAHVPFGNSVWEFWSTFPNKISFGEIKLFCHLQSIPNFRILLANGKQPMFTNKKREGINAFVCAVSLYVAKKPKASISYHEPHYT